jgi:GntR family transcriptional regulator
MTSMSKIDRSSSIPLHHQLKEMLRSKLSNNEWKSGEMLPSEDALQTRYNLSRTTVRQALSELVNEGWLVRQRGRGTWVSQRGKIAYDPSQSLELNDFMRQQGVSLGWRLIDIGPLDAPADVAGPLQLQPGTRVMRVRRLRLADHVIIGYHFSFISAALAEQVDLDVLNDGGSMDYLMQLKQMSRPVVRRTLEARKATSHEAKLLQMRSGDPVLRLERIVIGTDGMPVEYLQAAFCGDRFKYQITL